MAQPTKTLMLLSVLVANAVANEAVQFTKRPRLDFDADRETWDVTFELNRFSDVEVAIVDTTGHVVRHLAAGVLGGQPPPPFVAGSRAQMIAWDGRDDEGQAVADPQRCAARVRAGMSVSLHRIVGGDPYAYYSAEMPHGDHSPWGINGLELKADGNVYVLGHSSTLGPPALRQFDIDGNYRRTVFPPPAGLPIDGVKGWGINVKADGTYTPKFQRLTDPSVSTTILDGPTGGMARLLPTPMTERLSFWQTGFGGAAFDLLTIHRDGTVPPDEVARPGPLVKNPPLELGPVAPNSHIQHSLVGPGFTCVAPDGKHFFLSGLCGATTRYGSILEFKSDGFWRDGQVWKVDFETRTARVFFALDPATVGKAARDRASAIGGTYSCAALHGVAVDANGRVFVGDRLNRRIVVLDNRGQMLRELPVSHPDAVAVSARTGALYTTTRTGDERTGRGEVRLLKFADWQRDDKPVVDLPVSETGYTGHHKHSHLVLCESAGATNVWVAYTEMPVRIYRDDAAGFTLLKDFHAPTVQRCLGFDRIDVDAKTEEAYVLDDHAGVWKIGPGDRPQIVKTPLRTASIAIDSRRRHIYVRTLADGSSSYSVGKIARFHLDDPDYPPANFGDTGTNRLTPSFHHEWCFTGNGDKGFAVAPNGDVAVVGEPKDGLRLFRGRESTVPWEATKLCNLPNMAGGIRFDLAGNLYVGYVDSPPTTIPAGFADDRFARQVGRIHKFAPTASLAAGPTKTYDVPCGAFDADCIIRGPRFAVDGFGRIYYPTNIQPRIAIIDNAGNEILAFGTWGNRDSLGGLPGDLVPTHDIPLAFPNSVAVTDRFLYVGDMVNHRLLQIEKRFALSATGK